MPTTAGSGSGRVERLCPVCGRRYRADLFTHLDRKIKDSGGLSRCDWNLVEERIARDVRLLRRNGWVPAGSAPARVVALLKDTHPHLSRLTTSGSVATRVHAQYVDRRNDLKVWWTREWCRFVCMVPGWNTLQRVQVIKELDGDEVALTVLEAAFRVGGGHAVAALDGSVVRPRCRQEVDIELPHADRMGNLTRRDWCVLAAGHTGLHQGARTAQVWSASEIVAP